MTPPSNPINWFEIPVANMDRAVEFYQSVLGISLARNDIGPMQMAWFPISTGAPGASGALILSEGYDPSEAGTLVYFAVADLEASLRRVEELGGQTLMPKMSIGEHGFIAHVRDSEGNRVALHSRD
jgi:predicted enzyme related to lactoylglutathione lyase